MALFSASLPRAHAGSHQRPVGAEQPLDTIQPHILWSQKPGKENKVQKAEKTKSITARVSPRTFRIVALPAPSEREKAQLYLQRYIQRFPAAGKVVIFDRSRYNWLGIERVMGYC